MPARAGLSQPITRQRENMLLGSAARDLTSFFRSRFLVQFVNLESLYGVRGLPLKGHGRSYVQVP